MSAKVLHSSPLASYFLGQPEMLWDRWDNIVAALGRKVRRCDHGVDTCVRAALFALLVGKSPT